MLRYILLDKTPVLCNNYSEWREWMKLNDRKVKRDHIGDITVSTIFLGMDYDIMSETPMLFETRTFGRNITSCIFMQYSYWDEAVDGHEKAVKEISSYRGGSRDE